MEEVIDITVLMPAFNAADYIGEAIASVLAQSFTGFELLIVDDGSTDETRNIIKSFSDNRIKLVAQQNTGVAGALNTGLQHATGKYIARFDADDICNSERLSIQYQFMESHPQYVICGSDAEYIDMFGAFVFNYHCVAYTHEKIISLPYHTCPFIHSSTFFRKDAVIREGCYDIHAHGFEDHFLWKKILRKARGANIDKALVQVRLNPTSITNDRQFQPRQYRQLKGKILTQDTILPEQGGLLKQGMDVNRQLSQQAYYTLLAKKYLWNNYQPKKARENLYKSGINGNRSLYNSLLFLLSFLPFPLLRRLYKLKKKNSRYAY